MSISVLPKTIDLERFTHERQVLSGEIAISELERLKDMLMEYKGHVTYHFSGSFDALGYPVISGDIETELMVECQRCLKSLAVPIKSHFELAFVREGQDLEGVPDSYEVVDFPKETLELKALIEDELLLSLPMIPMHDPQVCEARFASHESKIKMEDNPFDILKNLDSDDLT